jgi:hypothetical protein
LDPFQNLFPDTVLDLVQETVPVPDLVQETVPVPDLDKVPDLVIVAYPETSPFPIL